MRQRRSTPRRIAAAVGWLALAGLGATVLITGLLRWIKPPTSSYMVQAQHNAEVSARADTKIRYQWSDWDEISPYVAIAVVAAEDQKFPSHRGFDVASIKQAIRENPRRRAPRGASTISQQVAKNLFLWPGRTVFRKGLEAYFTVLIELLWPKQRILEVYLNIAQFGPGVFGVRSASEVSHEHAWSRPPTRVRPRAGAELERCRGCEAHRVESIRQEVARDRRGARAYKTSMRQPA